MFSMNFIFFNKVLQSVKCSYRRSTSKFAMARPDRAVEMSLADI